MKDIVTQVSQFGAVPNKASDARSTIKRIAVLILGMHRSGTSPTTRVVSLLGADLPLKLMEAKPDNNICGFWESLEVYELNDTILASAASSWDDWRRFNPDWIRSPALKPLTTRALEILEDNFAKSPLFVLKDPRMCRLLPFWLEVFRKFGAHAKCIMPLRNPMEVAASMKRRDGFSPAKSHMLWLRHVIEAESVTRGMPRAFLNYEELLDNWRGTVARLADDLDLAWPRYSATAEVEIDRFLDKRHRHHNIEPEVLLDHSEIASWVKDTYASLRELLIDPNSKKPQQRLDEIRAEFDRASNALGSVVRADEMAREEANKAKDSRIQELSQCLDGQEEANKAKDSRIQELSQCLDGQEEANKAKDSRIQELSQRLDGQEEANKAKDSRIQELSQRLDEQEEANKAKDSQIKELRRGLNGQQEVNKAKDNQIQELKQSLDEQSKLMKDKNVRIEELQHSLTNQAGENNSKDRRINEMQQAIATKDNLIKEKRKEANELRKKSETINTELKNTRDELDSFRAQHTAEIQKIDSQREAAVDAYQAIENSLTWRLSKKTLNLIERIFFMRPIIFKAMSFDKWLKTRREIRIIRKSGLFDENYYLKQNPDVADAGVDPLRHFVEHGWKECRNPGGKFNINSYLNQNPDVAQAVINPLIHYIIYGKKEGRDISEVNYSADITKRSVNRAANEEIETVRKSIFFDNRYYRSTNADLTDSDMDMTRHYFESGWREGRNPSALFDTLYYLETNPDVRNAGINPLYHYIIAGKDEGRAPSPTRNCDYEDDCWFGDIVTDIKPIAFYLPQFHEIPENNKWWREGFTEWTNTRKAKPLIEEQYQPREPHDNIGYYDLSDWRVLKHQTEMAKAHGIYGFCFYHYWFAGKRLLEKPVDMFLDHPEIDFPFCLCWANENWTRRWDGFDNDVLIKQHHSAADDIAFIDDLKKYLEDERYIRIDGKPVILLYRPGILPNAKQTADRWRKRLRQKGVGEVYLLCAYGVFADTTTPCDYGFDAAYEFAPVIHMPHQVYMQAVSSEDFKGNLCSYRQFVEDVLRNREQKNNKRFDLYYSVMLEWDNTPRRGQGATIFKNYTSLIYRKWLDKTIELTRLEHSEDRRFVFINAWNEWAEGTYLEPDRRYGYLSLNETSRALCNIKPGRKLPKVSVVVPNYNHARFLRRRLDSIYNQTYKNIEVILMDDSSSDNSREILDEYAALHPHITRREYNETNSGKVFRQWAKGIKLAAGDLVWIAESDDFCDENFLDILVQCFEDEAVLLAYSHCVFVDEKEIPLAEGGFEYYVGEIDSQKWRSSYVETAHNEVRSAFGVINTIPNSSGVVFRRPHDLNLLDDEEWLSMSVAGDWVFYLHVIHGGKIAYNTKTTNYFRRYEGSAAESTYKREVYYREVGIAARTIASLYDVPTDILEQNRDNHLDFFKSVIGDNQNKFLKWYDFESVLEAQKNRRPAVMVSLFAFYSGGAEIMPIRLANEFKRQGLAVLLHSGKAMPRENRIRRMLRNDIPVLETDRTDEIRDAIREFGIEVLNSHHWHIQRYPASDPTVFADLPRHVATLHGMIEAEGDCGVTPEQLRLVDKYVDTWVYIADKNIEPFQSSGLYDEGPNRYVKIPNGMEPPNLKPIPRGELEIPDDAFVLCNVSRAIPEKGWMETMEVVKKARELTGKDIRLILVGDGLIYDEYCKKGIPDFVYMPGFDIRSVGYYATADMGIMLTRYRSESFPLTVLECLFAGKPYIVSNIGEIRNMLTAEEGLAGAVLELEDWTIPVDDAARMVADFVTDKRKYEQAKSRVSKAARRYTIENVAQQYLDLVDFIDDKTILPKALIVMRKPKDDTKNNKNASNVKKLSFYETNVYRKYEDTEESFKKEMVGFCPICEEKSKFASDHKWLRDNYRCVKCRSIPRQRYVQQILHSMVPGWKDMDIHESSPCNDFIKRCATGYTASQFCPDKKPGEQVGEFTNENIEALTFDNNIFDLFLSQDVLEHVFNPQNAIDEMLRVVKPGGYIIFTVPVFHGKKTVQRARVAENGNMEYIEDAVYHGNPVDDEGSLAVWDYGEDFIDNLKKWAADHEVEVFNHPIPELGIEGEFLDIFYLKKHQSGTNHH